jgi:hypothetical protein
VNILQTDTNSQFDKVIERCRELFQKKTLDYGTAWRILRPSSLADQIFIKASRIRSIEEKKVNKVGEPIEDEYVGIINYCIITIIQLDLHKDKRMEIPADEMIRLYDKEVATTKSLMNAKNHDYGEAWRDMKVSTFTDLILMKLLRVRQIDHNDGNTLASEGIVANYRDMMNYAIFALIQMGND